MIGRCSSRAWSSTGGGSIASFSGSHALTRDVDARKTRKALRKLARVTEAAAEHGADLSAWETDFVEGVSARLSTFGSAFRDGAKGALEEPLSALQGQKLRELLKKTRANPETKSGQEPQIIGGRESPVMRKKGLSRQSFGRSKKARRTSPENSDEETG